MYRHIERSAEWILSRFYSPKRHEAHYRRVMKVRAIVRMLSGQSLTNSPESGLPLFKQLSSATGFGGSQNVIDFGCGTAGIGIHFIAALTSGTYTGLDISPDALVVADSRLSSAGNTDRYRLETISGTQDIALYGPADIIIAQSVFTHNPLENFATFLNAARSSLAKGGVIATNFAISHIQSQIAQTDFIFTEEDILDVAEHAGFTIERVKSWRHPSQALRSAGSPVDTLYLFKIAQN